MIGTLLASIAAALVIGAGGRWFALAQRVRLPADATPYLFAHGAGVVLGAAGFALGVGTWGGVAAGFAMAGGLTFLGLYAASGQGDAVAAVRVGAPIVDFAARDDGDEDFELASLRGRPFLLKFFRGHWCPYCVAELRRWEDLRPALEEHGVAIVTVCADSAAEIRKGRSKHGLRAAMLADPELAITDLYNLRSKRNLAPKKGVAVPLPIPTTILVDAAGTVRWLDQSTDYMRRSDPERVLAAVRALQEDARPRHAVVA